LTAWIDSTSYLLHSDSTIHQWITIPLFDFTISDPIPIIFPTISTTLMLLSLPQLCSTKLPPNQDPLLTSAASALALDRWWEMEDREGRIVLGLWEVGSVGSLGCGISSQRQRRHNVLVLQLSHSMAHSGCSLPLLSFQRHFWERRFSGFPLSQLFSHQCFFFLTCLFLLLYFCFYFSSYFFLVTGAIRSPHVLLDSVRWSIGPLPSPPAISSLT
jgi:hypothetical protein